MADYPKIVSLSDEIVPLRLFAAFEGGGAKGLVHIGALKALESRGFQFKGLAGTSAGAVVAALKAAGYEADEIVNPQERTTIFDHYRKISGQQLYPTDLLGRNGFAKLRLLQALFSENGQATGQLALAIFIAIALVLSIGGNFCGLLVLTLIALFTIGGAFCASAALLDVGGICSLRTCRDTLQKLLNAKLFPDDPARVPTMGDFRENGRPSLRIVAADITTRRLRLFSSDSDADSQIPVADVVAASVCIPLIFRPWEIQNKLHVDGGLVSNLPAWPFDEERALDLDALTLAIEIEDRVQRDTQPNLKNWIVDVALTTAFGASVLNTRAVERLHTFRLGTDLATLDFDVSLDRALKAVNDATKATSNLIDIHLIDVPALFLEGCKQLQRLIPEALASIPASTQDSLPGGRVRVCVALREGDFVQSLKLRHSAGFENDADEGIILPIDGSYIGYAWRSGDSVLSTAPFDILLAPGSRRLNKLFAKDIRWIFAGPIYSDGSETSEPDFVVAVDGTHILNEDDKVFDDLLDLLAKVTDEVFIPIATKLKGG